PGYSASSSRSYPRASRRVWRSCSAYVAPTFRLMLRRPQLVGNGSRSMIASAVDTNKTGFFVLARRRNTEHRLPAISRDGSIPSNGRVFSLGNTSTSSEGSSEWSTLPSRSALFSSSARKTTPSRPDFLHCSRRWSANMPSGEEEETAERGEPLLIFNALAARAFMVFHTEHP